MYPEFKIVEVNSPKSLLGDIDRLKQGEEVWIEGNYLGYLLKESILVYGRWIKIKNRWRFTFNEGEGNKCDFIVNDTVSAIDGYWGERMELVIDPSYSWKLKQFQARKEWDHDHCEICWAKISETENKEHHCSNDNHPVCNQCYDQHVLKKDVSFVPANV
jgi:hypothetical protein